VDHNIEFTIKKHAFEAVIRDREVQKTLEELEVSVSLSDGKLFDILDADGSGELGISEMVEGILRLRGPVEKADVVSASLMLRSVQRDISEVDGKITRHLQIMERTRSELEYALKELKGQEPLSGIKRTPSVPRSGLYSLTSTLHNETGAE